MNGLVPEAAFPGLWLWLSVLLAAGCLLAGASGWRRERALRGRVRAVLGARTPEDAKPHGRAVSRHTARLRTWPLREIAGASGAAVLVLVVLGGAAGWLVGIAAGWLVGRWLHARMAGDERRRADAEVRAAGAQLPLTADLMAACFAAGSGPGQAAEAVGCSVGGPLGARLTRAATELRLGGEPSAVWGSFAQQPWGGGFARCMERAGTAGVPPVEPVTRLAAELRGRRAREATVRARRAAVLVTGPLGLCFLPAFLAIGVAPVVLGLARALW